jgi:hypothetical protein
VHASRRRHVDDAARALGAPLQPAGDHSKPPAI